MNDSCALIMCFSIPIRFQWTVSYEVAEWQCIDVLNCQDSALIEQVYNISRFICTCETREVIKAILALKTHQYSRRRSENYALGVLRPDDSKNWLAWNQQYLLWISDPLIIQFRYSAQAYLRIFLLRYFFKYLLVVHFYQQWWYKCVSFRMH